MTAINLFGNDTLRFAYQVMTNTHWSMRHSRVLNRLRSGEPAVAFKLNLSDPRVAEIAARRGYDAVWLDFEHVPNDTSAVENMVRAAKAYDVDAIVRVRRGSYTYLTLPLEMDAAGIMVPHLMDLEDAQRVVAQTRFHPLGRRPWDGGNSDGGFCMVPRSTTSRRPIGSAWSSCRSKTPRRWSTSIPWPPSMASI